MSRPDNDNDCEFFYFEFTYYLFGFTKKLTTQMPQKMLCNYFLSYHILSHSVVIIILLYINILLTYIIRQGGATLNEDDTFAVFSIFVTDLLNDHSHINHSTGRTNRNPN